MSKHYIIPIFVPHWGCPHDCVFCNQKRITGVKEEPRGEIVVETIKEYLSTIAKAQRRKERVGVAFYGGSFTAIPLDKQKELLEPAYNFLRSGEIQEIRLSTRPDYINKDILNFLKGFGVSVIELGVQSLDSDVLSLASRGHTREDLFKAVKLIKEEASFKLGLQMMLGLPGDNLEKAKATALEIAKLSPDFVRIYPTLVIKDTPLEKLFYRGEYLPLSIDEAVNQAKEVYLTFQAFNIPVIRIGLQPSEEINEDKVISGPFHPAFRELVESSIALDRIFALLEDNKERIQKAEEIVLRVAPKDISIVRGHKNTNVKTIMRRYNLKEIKVIPSEGLARREILLEILG